GDREGGVAVGAGGEDVQAEAGVWRGLRARRRASYQQHAGPGDEVDEQVLRGLPTPARQQRGLRAALPRVGAAVQLQALAQSDGAGQRGVEESGGAAQPAPLPRRLATEPPGLRLTRRLPLLKLPAPQSMTVRFFPVPLSCTVSLGLIARKGLRYKLLAADGSRRKERRDGATFSGSPERAARRC